MQLRRLWVRRPAEEIDESIVALKEWCKCPNAEVWTRCHRVCTQSIKECTRLCLHRIPNITPLHIHDDRGLSGGKRPNLFGECNTFGAVRLKEGEVHLVCGGILRRCRNE